MSGHLPVRNAPGGAPAGGRFKKGDREAIARHVLPGATTVVDSSGGTGVVAMFDSPDGTMSFPPRADFSKRKSASMAIRLLFKAARSASRIVILLDGASKVRIHEVVTAAREWYGGLSACEWIPVPPAKDGKHGATINTLMAFDRGRAMASPRWNPSDVTFVDLYGGVGGFRLALQGAGCRCVFSSETEDAARRTYFANWGEWPSGDIKTVSPDDVPEHQVLCAGFPCPAFSISGDGSGYADERGRLFFEIPRIAAIRRPCVLFLENVPAFASPNKPWLPLAKKILEGIGYRVFFQVINAGHHGVRTARERVYLVCIRKDLGITSFDFPQPSMEPVRLSDVLLPDVETDGCVVHNDRIHIDPDAVARSVQEPQLGLIHVGQIGEKENPSQGDRIYSPLGLASTFCATAGGSGGKTGLYLVNGRVRKLHPVECKRAMGFPDSFVLPPSVSAEQARKLFGNSIAVPVVRRIFDRIAGTLNRSAAPDASGKARAA